MRSHLFNHNSENHRRTDERRATQMVIMEYNRFPAEKSRAFVQITGEKIREREEYYNSKCNAKTPPC